LLISQFGNRLLYATSSSQASSLVNYSEDDSTYKLCEDGICGKLLKLLVYKDITKEVVMTKKKIIGVCKSKNISFTNKSKNQN
jgi:hypothetical protein